jgi:hypothetical protein
MTPSPQPSAESIQKLLERIESTKPVSKEVRCESPSGVVAYAKNPEWPPHRKGECEAADYGMWLYEEMPKLLAYIRTLEKEHRDLHDWVAFFSKAAISGAEGIIQHVKYEGFSTLDAEEGLRKLREARKAALSSLTLKP